VSFLFISISTRIFLINRLEQTHYILFHLMVFLVAFLLYACYIIMKDNISSKEFVHRTNLLGIIFLLSNFFIISPDISWTISYGHSYSFRYVLGPSQILKMICLKIYPIILLTLLLLTILRYNIRKNKIEIFSLMSIGFYLIDFILLYHIVYITLLAYCNG